jgi:hypothetical protein
VKPFVVLCMAGRYRRFRDAGYALPKYLLPARGRRILEWVVDGLGPDGLLLVANNADLPHEPAIRDCVPAGTEILWLGDTSGQAETAAHGAQRLVDDDVGGPVLFHNVDTIVRGRDLGEIGQILRRADGFVDTFPSDSPAFSYVALDGERVTAIAEKVVISPHATSGLYGFASPQRYLGAASTAVASREFYVSDVYRRMLEDGARIEVLPPAPGHETVVLGTPAEYEAWLQNGGSGGGPLQ